MSEIWEVPIIDGPSGVQIGVFRMDAGGYEEPSWEGAVSTAVHIPAVVHSPTPRIEPPRVRSEGIPAARDHVPLPVNPALYAKVRLLLDSPGLA